MSFAYRCEVCSGAPGWRIERLGDAIVSWACDLHLAEVCTSLRRGWERTELVVKGELQP